MRWCAMQYTLRERQKQSDKRWAYIQSVLTIVGNVTISWATIELQIAHLIIWHHRTRGLSPKEGWPRMLAKQLDHIKKIEGDGSVDDATSAKLTDFRLRVWKLNDFRISIIHGVLHQKDRRSTDWHTHSVKIEGQSARIVANHYTNGQIQLRSKEISELAHEMSPFIARIVGIPHPANSA